MLPNISFTKIIILLFLEKTSSFIGFGGHSPRIQVTKILDHTLLNHFLS